MEVYGKLSVAQVEEQNKHQMAREVWQTKVVMVHDNDRRRSYNHCRICTTSKYNAPAGADEWNLYHHDHYSSLHERVKNYPPERDHKYKCIPCKKVHMVNEGERVPLILSSTSIFKWFEKAPSTEFEMMHVDYIQIYGAKIRDLFMALRTEYSEENRPLDIICWCEYATTRQVRDATDYINKNEVLRYEQYVHTDEWFTDGPKMGCLGCETWHGRKPGLSAKDGLLDKDIPRR